MSLSSINTREPSKRIPFVPSTTGCPGSTTAHQRFGTTPTRATPTHSITSGPYTPT
jgi:hypothetical protein